MEKAATEVAAESAFPKKFGGWFCSSEDEPIIAENCYEI
jgi:hypothetical protein